MLLRRAAVDRSQEEPLDAHALTELFRTARPLIGVVHLQPLPGSPGFRGDRSAIRRRAVEDARAIAAGGMDGVLVENFGDAPFLPGGVPRHVVASLTAVVVHVVDAVDLPVGVNVLRNDTVSALAVAQAAGGAFVRANVWTGARLTDQGIVEGRAHEVTRLRGELGADVRVLADVDVKHSAPLAERPLEREVHETVERGLADAVVVTGDATGRPVDPAVLGRVRDAAGGTPVLAGSGVTVETVRRVLERCDGAIVGTALKRGGETRAPVDPRRVEALVREADGLPGSERD